jgi:hypothetical protein
MGWGICQHTVGRDRDPDRDDSGSRIPCSRFDMVPHHGRVGGESGRDMRGRLS